ncbi:hypothetical protein COOONC_23315 [Cooperia oncophora]
MEHQKGTFSSYFTFLFPQREKRIASSQKLCAVYGDEALKNGSEFRSDEERSGRPVEVDDDLIKAIIDSDRHSTTREIAEKLHVSHTCIENHLKQLGYVRKFHTWFFANKNQKFYERGIMMLPERWQKVIDKNGQYITE